MSIAPKRHRGGSFVTPLRYPGGKGRLGPWLAQLMRSNSISGGTYAEPYAGGAGAAIHLLTQGFVDRIVINDADPAIHAFWWSVLNDTEAFARRVRKCTVSMRQRAIHQKVIANPGDHDLFDVGFAAFFLNRVNRSGILSGGVIGGKNQDGKYKIDARFNREDLAERVERIGGMRDHVDLFGLDAMELLEKLDGALPMKSLTYLDPPYYAKGSQLYRNFYAPEDHEKIARRVLALKSPWLVTYDNCPEIKALYGAASSLEFSLYYSTHLSRATATEAMFYKNLEMTQQPYLRR